MIELPPIVSGALLVLLLGLAAMLLYRLVESRDNDLQWAELVATNGKLNPYKVGYWIGAFGGLWLIVAQQTTTQHVDSAVVLGWFGFLAGVVTISGMTGRGRPTPGVDTKPPPEAQP